MASTAWCPAWGQLRPEEQPHLSLSGTDAGPSSSCAVSLSRN
jgi:hypothetical protein